MTLISDQSSVSHYLSQISGHRRGLAATGHKLSMFLNFLSIIISNKDVSIWIIQWVQLYIVSVVSIVLASASESGGCGQEADTSQQPLGPGGVTGEAVMMRHYPGA